LTTVEKLKVGVSSDNPLSEQIKELWVALGLHGEQWSYAIGKNMVTRKTRMNKLSEKRLLIPW